jgi:hypothetical protein
MVRESLPPICGIWRGSLVGLPLMVHPWSSNLECEYEKFCGMKLSAIQEIKEQHNSNVKLCFTKESTILYINVDW